MILDEQPTERDPLEVKILEATDKISQLTQQEKQLAEQLEQTREMLARWDARRVTLWELKNEGFSRILKDEKPDEDGEV